MAACTASRSGPRRPGGGPPGRRSSATGWRCPAPARGAPQGHPVGRGTPVPRADGAHRFAATDPATAPDGVRGRFAVELAGQEAALALVRRVARPADAAG